MDNPRLPNHLLPVLGKKHRKEIDAGRILGPFDEVPLQNFRVSPIKLALKSVPGEYRSIHHLSYPYNEEAVNTSIPRDRVSVHYATVDDAYSSRRPSLVGDEVARQVLLRHHVTHGVLNVMYHFLGFLHSGSVDRN